MEEIMNRANQKLLTLDLTNVAELSRRLKAGWSTRERFKLNASPEDVARLLKASYIAELDLRLTKPSFTPGLNETIDEIAQRLTTADKCFGLMLMGSCGNGKTTMMRAICRVINYLNGQCDVINFYDARRLARLCTSKDGDDEFRRICSTRMAAIDDVGVEPQEIVRYGSHITPIADLIQDRYLRQLFTIITTNLTGEQIKDFYGERVLDRIHEMMHPIYFRDESFRNIPDE